MAVTDITTRTKNQPLQSKMWEGDKMENYIVKIKSYVTKIILYINELI